VREAIDRGVPLDQIKAGNKITAQLKKLIVPYAGKTAAPASTPLLKKLVPSLAR
jgi:pilus assembly protein CpaE